MPLTACPSDWLRLIESLPDELFDPASHLDTDLDAHHRARALRARLNNSPRRVREGNNAIRTLSARYTWSTDGDRDVAAYAAVYHV